jgi:hypothetical protein
VPWPGASPRAEPRSRRLWGLTLPRRFLDSAGAIVAVDSALFGRNLMLTLEKILSRTR